MNLRIRICTREKTCKKVKVKENSQSGQSNIKSLKRTIIEK